MFWDRESETLARPALERLQLQLLQKTVHRLAKRVPFYQRKFAELRVEPDNIQSLDDIRRLPFTTSEDRRITKILADARSGTRGTRPSEGSRLK